LVETAQNTQAPTANGNLTEKTGTRGEKAGARPKGAAMKNWTLTISDLWRRWWQGAIFARWSLVPLLTLVQLKSELSYGLSSLRIRNNSR
jgi:hypothetical protein